MPASLVVVNPNASRARDPRRRGALIDDLRAILERRDGVAPLIVETASSGDTAPAVRDALERGVAAVVGMGGDGTLREIAACLRGSSVPLGIVPAGTGNIMGGSLGVPSSPAAAVAALADATPRTIDLGLARCQLVPEPGPSAPSAQPPGLMAPPTTEATFAIGCGIGFDARLMAATPADLKRRIGRAAYFAQAARLAATIKAIPYRITVDGQLLETEASIAMVTNMGQLIPGLVGPRLPIVPDDGLLDVIVVGARGPVHGFRGLLDQLLRTSLGGASGADTLRVRGRVIRLESEPPEPLQVDGDHLGWGSIEATVLPAALRVLVPRRTG